MFGAPLTGISPALLFAAESDSPTAREIRDGIRFAAMVWGTAPPGGAGRRWAVARVQELLDYASRIAAAVDAA